METTFDDVKREAVLSGGQTIHAFHKSGQCFGEFCPVHDPSDHKLRGYDLHYNFMAGSFFRDVDGEMVVDPDDYVLNTAGKVIVFNLISCNHCGDLVASTHRHDFRSCSCGKVAADGGSAYLRRLGSAGDFKELSVIAYK
jgi:hypothetical protein